MGTRPEVSLLNHGLLPKLELAFAHEDPFADRLIALDEDFPLLEDLWDHATAETVEFNLTCGLECIDLPELSHAAALARLVNLIDRHFVVEVIDRQELAYFALTDVCILRGQTQASLLVEKDITMRKILY